MVPGISSARKVLKLVQKGDSGGKSAQDGPKRSGVGGPGSGVGGPG